MRYRRLWVCCGPYLLSGLLFGFVGTFATSPPFLLALRFVSEPKIQYFFFAPSRFLLSVKHTLCVFPVLCVDEHVSLGLTLILV